MRSKMPVPQKMGPGNLKIALIRRDDLSQDAWPVQQFSAEATQKPSMARRPFQVSAKFNEAKAEVGSVWGLSGWTSYLNTTIGDL